MRTPRLPLIFFLGFCAPSWADFSPANIGDGPDSMPRHVHVPDDTLDGDYHVRCEGTIRANGKSYGFMCYRITETTPQALVKAIARAGERARFVPAVDNGKPVTVFMLSSAMVRVEGSRAKVAVFPNDGINRKKYGLNYVSPQRLNQFEWRSGVMSKRARMSLRIYLSIDEHGKVTDTRIDDASSAGAPTLRAVQRTVDLMDFRPGVVGGQPTAMEYLEVVVAIAPGATMDARARRGRGL